MEKKKKKRKHKEDHIGLTKKTFFIYIKFPISTPWSFRVNFIHNLSSFTRISQYSILEINV
jgi:hypothetical protein